MSFRTARWATAVFVSILSLAVTDARGIRFFVLDYVEVGGEVRFVDPVVFEFASAKLYYPPKTTNSFGGKGEIDLFIAAPAGFSRSVRRL
jgi:hypothetical protein